MNSWTDGIRQGTTVDGQTDGQTGTDYELILIHAEPLSA